MGGKLWVVVRREFAATVWRKGWIIGPLSTPLLVGLYALVVSIPMGAMERRESEPRTFGLVDLSGLIRLADGGQVATPAPREVQRIVGRLGETSPGAGLARDLLAPITFRPFAAEEEGRRALEADEVSTLFVIPADVLSSGEARPGPSAAASRSDAKSGGGTRSGAFSSTRCSRGGWNPTCLRASWSRSRSSPGRGTARDAGSSVAC